MGSRYTLGLRRSAQIIRAEHTVETAAYKALRALGDTARTQLEHSHMNPDVLDTRNPAWQHQIDRHLIPAIAAVFAHAYEAPITAAAQPAEADDGITLAQQLADQYLASGARNRLVGVADTVYGTITAAIREGRATGEGESIPQLTARVDALLSDTQRWRNRARVIARTETLAAHSAGSDAAATVYAQQLGHSPADVVKEWLATGDHRTRASHSDANGQQVQGMNTPFSVGGSPLLRPGDPNGPAEETVNCRCTVLHHYPGDADYPADYQPTVTTATPDPLPEPEFVNRIHSDLAAGNISPDQLRSIVAGKSRLAQVNVEAAISRHEAEQAALAATRTTDAMERAGVAARVETPQEVYEALMPRRGGWNTTTRQKVVAELRGTPQGRQLLKTIDAFQSGGATAIPRLRTDVEKYLAGGQLPQGRVDAIENLLSAIGNSPGHDGSLYRGMVIPGSPEEVLARYTAGTDVDLSVASFSSDKSLAQGFTEQGAGQRIRTKNNTGVLVEWAGFGKKALPIERLGKSGVFADEKEWVVSGRYRVTGARIVRRGGKETVVVQIEQVGTW